MSVTMQIHVSLDFLLQPGHPHVPSEFDHLDFSMEAQVKANISTIHKIGRSVADYSDELPFGVACFVIATSRHECNVGVLLRPYGSEPGFGVYLSLTLGRY